MLSSICDLNVSLQKKSFLRGSGHFRFHQRFCCVGWCCSSGLRSDVAVPGAFDFGARIGVRGI